MRILLAEDEAALRHALTVLLERNCYTVDAVDNGQDALEYLRTGDYGCAVLDVMMPRLDGFSVVQQLGIDCGQGMISEETNKALGRFIDLAMLNLGGQAQLSSNGTAGMATLEQGYLTLDPDAKPGDYVQLGIRQEDGTASLRIIRKTADTWVFAYQK